MTRIYLDVNDRVRVDKTPSSEQANSAELQRGLLKLYQRLEGVAHRVIALREASGKGTESAQFNLESIHSVSAEIRADAP